MGIGVVDSVCQLEFESSSSPDPAYSRLAGGNPRCESSTGPSGWVLCQTQAGPDIEGVRGLHRQAGGRTDGEAQIGRRRDASGRAKATRHGGEIVWEAPGDQEYEGRKLLLVRFITNHQHPGQDEVKRVRQDRKKAEQRLRRLVQVYVDGHLTEEEYRHQKKQQEEKLRLLIVPDADAAVTAGKFLENLPSLWEKADLGERWRLLTTMLDAVYLDTVEEKRIVAIRPKPAFRPLLEIATTREESDIVLVHDEKEDEDLGEAEPEKQGQPPAHRAEAGLASRGGDGGESNYTVSTNKLCCWRLSSRQCFL